MSKRPANFIRTIALGVVTALTLAGASACASPMPQRSPDQMLNLTVSGISAIDRIAFSGRTSTKLPSGLQSEGYAFEGEIIDHTKLNVKAAAPLGSQAVNHLHTESGMNTAEADLLNPVKRLEGLQRTKKSVTVDTRSSGKLVILQIAIDETKAKQEAASELRNNFKRTVTEALARKTSKNKDVRQAMNMEITRSKAELESMIRSLSVQSEYELSIDKSRYLPQNLKETTMLHYNSNGAKRVEKRVTNYAFGSFERK